MTQNSYMKTETKRKKIWKKVRKTEKFLKIIWHLARHTTAVWRNSSIILKLKSIFHENILPLAEINSFAGFASASSRKTLCVSFGRINAADNNSEEEISTFLCFFRDF